MGVMIKNNAVSTITTAISASDVGLAVAAGTGSIFPVLGVGDYFYATLVSSGGTYEVIKVTARVGDTMTIVRAQEGTTAQSFASGSRIEVRVTTASITDMVSPLVASSTLAAPGSRSLVGDLAIVTFPTVAAMLADTSAARGAGSVWRAGPYTYAEAASSATNHNLTTAGGVKLYVDAPDYVDVEALGSLGDGTTVNTAAWQAAIQASVRIGHRRVRYGRGVHVVGALTFPMGQFQLLGPCGPKNQAQLTQLGFIRAAIAGQTTFTPARFGDDEPGLVAKGEFRDVIMMGADSNDISTIHIDIPSGVDAYSCRLADVGFLFGDWGLRDAGDISFAWTLERVHGWWVDSCIAHPGSSVSTELKNCRMGRTRPDVTVATITGMTLASAITYNGVSIQQPRFTTSAPHGLTNGKFVWIEGITTGPTIWNNRRFVAVNCTSTTFELKGINGVGVTAWSAGGTANKCGIGYWLSSEQAAVYTIDNSNEGGGPGSVEFVIGRSPGFNYFDEGFKTAKTTFHGAHYEGIEGDFIHVASGSNIDIFGGHFMNGKPNLPQAIFFEFLNDTCLLLGLQIKTKVAPQYTPTEGSYQRFIRCAAVDATKGEIVYSLGDQTQTLTTLNDTTSAAIPTRVLHRLGGGKPRRAVFRPSNAGGISAGDTQITFTVVSNPDALISGNTFVMPYDGFLRIGGKPRLTGTADQGNYQIAAKIAGAVSFYAGEEVASGTGQVHVPLTGMGYIASGTVVTLNFIHQTGGSPAFDTGQRSQMWVEAAPL